MWVRAAALFYPRAKLWVDRVVLGARCHVRTSVTDTTLRHCLIAYSEHYCTRGGGVAQSKPSDWRRERSRAVGGGEAAMSTPSRRRPRSATWMAVEMLGVVRAAALCFSCFIPGLKGAQA